MSKHICLPTGDGKGRIQMNTHIRCCENVFASFLISYFVVYLSHLNVLDPQKNVNIRQR